MRRTCNLRPVLQIIQKFPQNYYPCLYQSIGLVWWHKLCGSKDSKMHHVLCTNSHHDITDLTNHVMENTKTWISWERNITFLRNQKILNLYLRSHILRKYGFVAEVTFNRVFLKFVSDGDSTIILLFNF